MTSAVGFTHRLLRKGNCPLFLATHRLLRKGNCPLFLAFSSTDLAATVLNKPAGGSSAAPHRVRVTGILFARPGARYGHMGGYRYQLQATRLEYLP